MITNHPARHNAGSAEQGAASRASHPSRHTVSQFLLVLIGTLALAACGNQEASQTETKTSHAATMADCPVVLDTSAWRTFTNLGDRIMAEGESVPMVDLQAYAEEPVMATWRQTQNPPPQPVRVGNWLAAAFADVYGAKVSQKRNPDRVTMKSNYRYSYDNRAAIEILVTELGDSAKCQLDDHLRTWIDPTLLPEPLILNILPALAEIRTHEDRVYIDSGVMFAGGLEQTMRQITALLYRNLMAVQGPNLLETTGEQAIGNSFRALMNEAIGSWIEQGPYTHFRTDHPSLARVVIIPETFFRRTIHMIEFFEGVEPLLDNPTEMEAKGQNLPRSLFASGALSQGGYGMAAAIVGRFGEDRLRQVAQSVPGFLAAYQEAALMNPSPLPLTGATGTELYESLPPLDPELFQKIHTLLLRLYPQ